SLKASAGERRLGVVENRKQGDRCFTAVILVDPLCSIRTGAEAAGMLIEANVLCASADRRSAVVEDADAPLLRLGNRLSPALSAENEHDDGVVFLSNKRVHLRVLLDGVPVGVDDDDRLTIPGPVRLGPHVVVELLEDL